MSESISPVILAGPSLLGKSMLAGAWADTAPGQIINADKYYMYAGEFFMLGLGLRPEDVQDGRQRHLFGYLEPSDPPPSQAAYVDLAIEAIDRAHTQDQLAVVEGCSYTYTMGLIGHYGLRHALRLAPGPKLVAELKLHCFDFYNELVRLGLYQETERALAAGLKETYPMSSLIYRHAINCVEGTVFHEETTRRVIKDWTRSIFETSSKYDAVQGLRPIRTQ